MAIETQTTTPEISMSQTIGLNVFMASIFGIGFLITIGLLHLFPIVCGVLTAITVISGLYSATSSFYKLLKMPQASVFVYSMFAWTILSSVVYSSLLLYKFTHISTLVVSAGFAHVMAGIGFGALAVGLPVAFILPVVIIGTGFIYKKLTANRQEAEVEVVHTQEVSPPMSIEDFVARELAAREQEAITEAHYRESLVFSEAENYRRVVKAEEMQRPLGDKIKKLEASIFFQHMTSTESARLAVPTGVLPYDASRMYTDMPYTTRYRASRAAHAVAYEKYLQAIAQRDQEIANATRDLRAQLEQNIVARIQAHEARFTMSAAAAAQPASEVEMATDGVATAPGLGAPSV